MFIRNMLLSCGYVEHLMIRVEHIWRTSCAVCELWHQVFNERSSNSSSPQEVQPKWSKMLEKLALLALLLVHFTLAQELTLPYFNIAEKKKVSVNATCGEDFIGKDSKEFYCKLVGYDSFLVASSNQIFDGQVRKVLLIISKRLSWNSNVFFHQLNCIFRILLDFYDFLSIFSFVQFCLVFLGFSTISIMVDFSWLFKQFLIGLRLLFTAARCQLLWSAVRQSPSCF